MTRRYVWLPSDEEVVAVWRRLGHDVARTADELGCSRSAVNVRLLRAGLVATRNQAPALLDRIVVLEGQLNRLLELEGRVHALEARPIAAVALREDHRRIVDGGKGARHARRRRAG